MHNGTIMLGIQELCIGPNIKWNKKSRYVHIHMRPLSACTFKKILYNWKTLEQTQHNFSNHNTTQ